MSLPVIADEAPVQLVRQGLPHDALYDITFVGTQGIAVGDHGSTLVSEDGGVSWQAVQSVTETAMLAVAANEQRVVVVGQQGTIFAGDSAAALAPVESPSSERLMSVAVHANGLAVVVGGFGTVLVSEDAGTTWIQAELDWMELQPEGLEAHLYDVAISAEGDILICGEFGMVLASSDRGKTWRVQHRGEASLFAMHLDDQGLGFAVGQEGTILRTTDMGQSWQSVESNSAANLLDVWHSAQGEVVAIGIRALLRSNDKGTNWSPISDAAISRVWYAALAPGIVNSTFENGTIHAQRVYAAGQGGTVVTITK